MLTDAQRTDVRRYMGHPVLNAGEPDTVYAKAYSRATFPVSLTVRLDNLTATEQDVLTNTFLSTLATLEAAIPTAGDNLDTEIAGPWTARKDEIAQRSSLFDRWRREMCGFLGFAPGPALGGGGFTLVRA
jgi:hypothetical protein